MRTSYAQRTTLTYSFAAVFCVAAPLLVPAEHERVAMTVALAIGAPLAVLAVLLACLHIALSLQARTDWLIATAFAVAAVLGTQPIWYWWPAIGSWLVRVGPLAFAIAGGALAWLAVRAWRASSPTRYVLAVGVGLVALLFATSAYVAFANVAGNIEAASQTMANFFLDGVVAATVLVAGLAGHTLRRPKAAAGAG